MDAELKLQMGEQFELLKEQELLPIQVVTAPRAPLLLVSNVDRHNYPEEEKNAQH